MAFLNFIAGAQLAIYAQTKSVDNASRKNIGQGMVHAALNLTNFTAHQIHYLARGHFILVIIMPQLPISSGYGLNKCTGKIYQVQMEIAGK